MVQKSIYIICGSILIGIGINYFLIPHHLVNGGMIGVGLILNYAFQLKPGLMIILLSIPLYIFAFFRYKSYFFNGLHGVLISAFLIDWLQPLSLWSATPILFSAILGGLFVGTGVSLLLLVKASTGGGDLLALMIAQASGLNVGLVIYMIDLLVILTGSILIRETTMFYSFILITVIGFTTYTLTNIFK